MEDLEKGKEIKVQDNNDNAAQIAHEDNNGDNNKSHQGHDTEQESSYTTTFSSNSTVFETTMKTEETNSNDNEGERNRQKTYYETINTQQMSQKGNNIQNQPDKAGNKAKDADWKFGSFKYYRHTYLTIVIIISIFVVTAFVYLACIYKNDTDKIVEIQKNDYNSMEQIIGKQNKLRKEDQQTLLDIFEKHENRIENIMEMQHAKLDSDFNFISVWGAALTIVFLVFSIYSIFKTDEMLRHAEEESKRLHEVYQKTKEESKDALAFSQNSYNAVNNAINELQQRLSSINILLTQSESRANSMIKENKDNKK